MNYFITGVAGFIGSHVAERLLAEGHSVIGIDNFDSFYQRRIKAINLSIAKEYNTFTFHEGDIQDYQFLTSVTHNKGIDAIIHLAAKAGVRPSIIDPIGYQHVNVGGTQNILELARHVGINKVIYGSSSSVYGVNPNCPWKESDHVLQPISPYASSKVSGELLGHVYAELFQIQFIALRFFTVYGPRQRPDLAIHKFVSHIFRGDAIPVYGDGSTARDYTYIDDIVEGIVIATHYTESQYEIFNLGNQRTIHLHRLIEIIEEVMDTKAIIDRQDQQAGDVQITNADISKANLLLGYTPKTDISYGINQFKDWYLNMKKRGIVV